MLFFLLLIRAMGSEASKSDFVAKAMRIYPPDKKSFYPNYGSVSSYSVNFL